MKKFIKGYDIVDTYPEDGWLKGYFYVRKDDSKSYKFGEVSEAYQDLDYIRRKDYVLHLLDIKKGEKILDIGCASGTMMVYCGLLGAEVYGVDLSPKNIEEANKYLKRYALKGKAIIGDARKLSFKENYFDRVISFDFFEHLKLKDNILLFKELKRVLKPGGAIVTKTPNLTYLKFSRLYKMILRVIRLKNPFDVIIPHITTGSLEHIGLVTKRRMVKAIKSAGFMNFKFYHDANPKVERFNYLLGNLLAETPFLRDIFTEDLIVVIYKPIILSFFP